MTKVKLQNFLKVLELYNMKIDVLEKEGFDFLLQRLVSNKGMNHAEYNQLSLKHPYAVMRNDNALILSSMCHYGLHDEKLNSFLMNRFGKKEYEIDFFYQLIYNVGDYTNPHIDAHFVKQTTLVLLDDDFSGGDLIISDKKIPFNKKGTFINFDGNKNQHSVEVVTRGTRKVLVIMFNNKKSLV